jgi:hypothetical protein
MFHHERRGPRIHLVAGPAPQLGPGPRIQRHDEGFALMIPENDEAIAVQHGRAARLSDHGKHVLAAEALLPEERAAHVVRVQAARVEEGEDVAAVGDGRARRPRPVPHGFRTRSLFGGRPLPQNPAGRAIDRHHDVAVHAAWFDGPERRVRRRAFEAGGHGRDQKQRIAPDDRGRRAAPGDLDLPPDVLRLAPLDGRIRKPRHARGLGPAPLRPEPVAGLLRGHLRRSQPNGSCHQRQKRSDSHRAHENPRAHPTTVAGLTTTVCR